ncbi:MAG: hypothetical protein EHM58_13045 [Ignavibacteriae bacterium]|nr:MAG: hypothetical protein EHM58_13045 [Ignavibacteriota bacterium]
MSYSDDYYLLKKAYASGNSHIISGFDIVRIPFYSPNDSSFLPGDFQDCNDKDNAEVQNTSKIEELNNENDINIDENNNFTYTLFKNRTQERAKKVIILLHGFNEKHWDKYLPWAKSLFEGTGKDVILFPISFHMNRAPGSWSNSRLMDKLSKYRKNIFTENKSSSFINASISNRMQVKPSRFLWSGIKTVNDIIELVNQVKSGKHKYISPEAKIDFFGYSIGAFLSEILFMINPYRMFDKSKLFIFCGGSTFNKMKPVSKFIIDHAANYMLQSYYVNEFEQHIKSNEGLKGFFRTSNSFAIHFKCMLNYNKMKSYREKRLREISSRITALALKKDFVFPPENIIDTLTGEKHDIPVKIKVMDFPYDYDHVNPFPLNEKIKHLVNNSFNEVFDFASKELAG